MKPRRAYWIAAVLFSLPLGLLVLSYTWLAIDHGTWRLGEVVIHEDGQHTGCATVLYWRHFLREIPIAALYAAMTVAAWRVYGPEPARPRRRARGVALAAAALIIAAAWIGATSEAGWSIAAWDFLQAYVRDDEWAYGSHWRAHLLSNVGYLCAAIGAASLVGRSVDGRFAEPRAPIRARWLGGIGATMVVLTLLWRPTWDPFLAPRVIGHQAREIATHVLMSLPLALGVAFVGGRGAERVPSAPPTQTRMPREVAAFIALGVLLALTLGVATVVTRAADRTWPAVPLSSLVAAHVLEHTLDYVFIVCLMLAWVARQDHRT